jgi:hypothetical protein
MQLACRSRCPAAWKRARWPLLPAHGGEDQGRLAPQVLAQNTVPRHKSDSSALLFHDRARRPKPYCTPIATLWVPAMPEHDLHLPAFNGGGVRRLSSLQIPKLIVTFDSKAPLNLKRSGDVWTNIRFGIWLTMLSPNPPVRMIHQTNITAAQHERPREPHQMPQICRCTQGGAGSCISGFLVL